MFGGSPAVLPVASGWLAFEVGDACAAAGSCGSVAVLVFWAGVAGAVVVVVAEVPWCVGGDGLFASPAGDPAGLDVWCPAGAFGLVAGAVAAGGG